VYMKKGCFNHEINECRSLTATAVILKFHCTEEVATFRGTLGQKHHDDGQENCVPKEEFKAEDAAAGSCGHGIAEGLLSAKLVEVKADDYLSSNEEG